MASAERDYPRGLSVPWEPWWGDAFTKKQSQSQSCSSVCQACVESAFGPCCRCSLGQLVAPVSASWRHPRDQNHELRMSDTGISQRPRKAAVPSGPLQTLRFKSCDWSLQVAASIGPVASQLHATTVAFAENNPSASWGLPQDLRLLSDIVRLEPHDAHFSQCIQLLIPICTCHISTDKNSSLMNPPVLWRYIAERSAWEPVAGGTLGSDSIFRIYVDQFCIAAVCQSQAEGCQKHHKVKLTALASRPGFFPEADERGQMELRVLMEPKKPQCRRCNRHARRLLEQLTWRSDAQFVSCGEAFLEFKHGTECQVLLDGIPVPSLVRFNCDISVQLLVLPQKPIGTQVMAQFGMPRMNAAGWTLCDACLYFSQTQTKRAPVTDQTTGERIPAPPVEENIAQNRQQTTNQSSTEKLEVSPQRPESIVLLRRLISAPNPTEVLEAAVNACTPPEDTVFYLRFKKISPRGLEKDAAACCGLILRDFLGCIAKEPAALSALVIWLQSRLWDGLPIAQRHMGAKVHLLDEATTLELFGGSEVSLMAQSARRAFHMVEAKTESAEHGNLK